MQVAPSCSDSRSVERRAPLATPPPCGHIYPPTVEALAQRTGRQKKRKLCTDSDNDAFVEETPVGYGDAADALDRPKFASSWLGETRSGRSEVGSAAASRSGRVSPASALLLVSLADTRLQVAGATLRPCCFEQESARAPEEASDFTQSAQ